MTIQATGSYVSYNKPKDPPKKQSTQLGLSRRVSKPPVDIRRERAQKTQRFEINRRSLQILQRENHSDLRSSRFFTYQPGGPNLDSRFQNIFEECFVFMGGKEGLLREGAYKIISSLDKTQVDRTAPYRYLSPGLAYYMSCYSDVYDAVSLTATMYPLRRMISHDCEYAVIIRPTKEFRERLERIIDGNAGLFREFLLLLKNENRGIQNWAEADGRLDYNEQSFSGVFKGLLFAYTLGVPILLYGKFGDEVKTIYSRLLGIKWLEQDQQRLAWDLNKGFIPQAPTMFFPEVFSYLDGVRYVSYPTLGDGACALHALLGENVNGEYRYRGNVRKAFIDALRQKRDDPHVQQMLLDILKGHLDNVENDPSSRMLFSNVPNTWPYEYALLKSESTRRLEDLRKQEAELWVEELEKEGFKEKFLEVRRNDRLRGGHAPETPEQVLAGIRQNSFSVLDTICGDEQEFIPFLDGHEQRKLFYLRHTKEEIENKKDEEGDRLLLSDEAFDHYAQVVQKDGFWFNVQEIELASHLFDKKAQLFSVTEDGHLTRQVFNPDLEAETVHILHRPGHFCRIAPSDENTLLDLVHTYIGALEKGHQQLKRDEIAQNLLNSTIRQEIAQLSVSGGVSFLTVNPLFIGSQAVKSSTSIAIAYLDPFRDSQISRGAETFALPIFKIATGDQFKSVAVSFIVDQSMRQLCKWDKEKTGVETPEWAQRMVIIPITTIADAALVGSSMEERAVKVISGVFGATIKGGMDEALHKWEERCGIDEAYWINNPSWGQCFAKALATNDAPQEIAANFATKWVLKDIKPKVKETDEPVDEIVEEAQPEEVVYEIIFPENGSHLLPLIKGNGISGRYEIRKTHDTHYNGTKGKDEKINERFSVFYIGSNGETKVDDLPNETIAGATIKLHEQASMSSVEFVQQAYEIQQALANQLGIPVGAIPPVQFKEIYVGVNYPPGDGKAKCYVNGAEKSNLEVKGKHKGTKPLENLGGEIAKNRENNNTVLKRYIADLNARFGLNIELPSAGKLNLLNPYVEKDGKNYKVTAIGLDGEMIKLGSANTESDATVLANRVSTLQSETINQQSQCIQMEQQLIQASIPLESRPKFPAFETFPQHAGKDPWKTYSQMNASSIRNRNATTQYLADGNNLLETPFQPQAMTKQEIDQLSQAFMPHIEKADKEHGFFFNAWRDLGNAKDTFMQWCNDHGVSMHFEVNVPIVATSSPKPTEGYHERQMGKAAAGLPTDTVLGCAGPDGVTWNNHKPPEPSGPKPTDLSALLPPSTPERPMIGDSPAYNWNWQSLQSYQNALTMQTVENAIASRSLPQLPTPQERLDLSDPTRSIELAHRELWGQGFLDRDVELKLPSMQQAGFSFFEVDGGDGRDLRVLVDNDFVKTIPKGWGRVGIAALKLLVPDMSDIPGAEDPHTHLDRVAQNVGRMYDEIVHIEDPNSFVAKAGTFVGECMAVSPVFKITRLAQLPGVFCAIAENSTVGAIFYQADNQSPLEGALLGGAIGGGLHKLVGLFQFSRGGVASLLNRAEPIGIRPLGDEAAFLRGLNTQAYRSGIVGEGTVAKLAGRNIANIKPQKYPTPVRTQVALNKKLSALQDAQKDAAKIRNLKDGRIRYYDPERVSKTPGPTRGSSYVTEYNSKTGQIRSWNECYDWNGNVNRVHPKMIDGQKLEGQHYPLTQKEMEIYLK